MKPKEPIEFEPLGAREMFVRGWLLYRPRHAQHEVSAIQEEGYDPSMTLAGPLPERQLERPQNKQFRAVLRYVYTNVFRSLHAHPLASMLSAVEDRLHTKIFMRPTRLLGDDIHAVSKFFPLQALQTTSDPTPIAFYGALFRLPAPEECRDFRLLEHRLNLAHEIAHHYLHLAPWLRAVCGNAGELRDLFSDYDRALSEGRLPDTTASATLLEAEADVLAALTLLDNGYVRMSERTAAELVELKNNYDLSIDTQEFVDLVRGFHAGVVRPSSIKTVRPAEATRPARSIGLSTISPQRLSDLSRIAKNLSEECRERPYAWICRAIEDRFLPRKGERRRACNVQVKLTPDSIEQSYCLVERIDLQSAFAGVNQYLLQNPPHLITYKIHFPYEWNVVKNPNHRSEIFSWLGLIDCVERKQPPKRGAIAHRRFLVDYTADQLRLASYFAASLDALVAHPTRREAYGAAQSRALLDLIGLGTAEWRSLLKSQRLPQTKYLSTLDPSPHVMEDAERRKTGAIERLEKDETWFRQQHESLRKQFGCGCLAVYENSVIMHRRNEGDLVHAVRAKYGNISIYVGALGDVPRTDPDEQVFVGLR